MNPAHVGIRGTIHLFRAGGFFFFFLPKPSFAYISISDEIERVMKDELPEARFVAADNICRFELEGSGDQSAGLLRSLPPGRHRAGSVS